MKTPRRARGGPLLLHVALLLLHTGCRASEPAETLCGEDTCYALQFGKRDFDAAQEFCGGKGGSLTTMASDEEAAMLETLISSFEAKRPTPPQPEGRKAPKTKLWMGLRRRRRQCVVPKKPLRGFHWVTGDDAGSYSNWAKEPVESCTAERCVALSYRFYVVRKSGAVDLKWEEGNCNLQTEFICKYPYAHMCPQLELLGPGHAVYTTPFGATSSQLASVPEGSTAEVYCDHAGPGDAAAATSRSSATCESRGWSTPSVSCPPPAEQPAGCGANNGGCDHICRPAGSDAQGHRCECIPGFQLGPDARTCVSPAVATDPCLSDPCPHECAAGGPGGGYTCLCPRGYEPEPGSAACVDVDECALAPCEMLCVNTPGSFECSCVKWFAVDPGNPRGCVYRDACSASNCEHECDVDATTGDAECRCRPGYELQDDGESCADANECERGPCDQLCQNVPEGSFTCDCTPGYVLGEDQTSCFLDTDATDYEDILDDLGKFYEDRSEAAIASGSSSTPRPPLLSTTRDEGTLSPRPRHGGSSVPATSSPRPGVSEGKDGAREPSGRGVADSTWLVIVSAAAVALVLLVLSISTLAACRRSRRRKQDQSKQSVDELWMAVPSPSPAAAHNRAASKPAPAVAAAAGSSPGCVKDSGEAQWASSQADARQDRGDLAEVNGNANNGSHTTNALSDLLNEDSGAEVIVVD